MGNGASAEFQNKTLGTTRQTKEENERLRYDMASGNVGAGKPVQQAKTVPDYPAEFVVDDCDYDSDIDNEIGENYDRRKGRSGVVIDKDDIKRGATEFDVPESRPSAEHSEPKWTNEMHQGQIMAPNTDEPDSKLKAEFAHGYRGHDCRNNLFYNKSGEVVFNTAGLGVVYDIDSHTQRFFMEHTDDVVSMALHPNGHLVASGQVGKKASIFVWDSKSPTCAKEVELRGHERGVCCLAFFPCGRRLVSVGMDENCTLMVWDWKTKKTLASTPTGKNNDRKLFQVAVNPYKREDEEIVTVGKKHICFWKMKQDMVQKHSAHGFGHQQGVPNGLCVAFTPKHTLIGTSDGAILKFDPNSYQLAGKLTATHQGPVHSLWSHSETVISAGKDGKVSLWDPELGARKIIDLSKVTSSLVDSYGRPLTFTPCIRSVYGAEGRILVGTRTSEVFEIRGEETRLLLQGHSDGQVWGLATHPKENTFVTASDDKTIRLWEMDTKRMSSMRMIGCPASCAAFSPSGDDLAIGLRDGSCMVVDGRTLNEKFHPGNQSEQVSVVKYSPDGKYLAMACRDGWIEIFETGNYASKCHKQLGAFAVTHLDWDVKSTILQVNTNDQSIFYWNIATNKQVAKKDVADDWATWTCIFGWAVRGIFQGLGSQVLDGTDVNAAYRSHSKHYIATGDDFGLVSLYRYPVPNTSAKRTLHYGHSAHVTNVAFSHDDKYLVSIGGADRTIIQWRHVRPGEDAIDDAFDDIFDSDVECEKPSSEEMGRPEASEFVPFLEKLEFPSDMKPDNSDVKDAIALEHVHGYRGYDCGANLFYINATTIVYNAAAVGIVCDTVSRQQKFFMDHDDDITCLHLSADHKYVATGQVKNANSSSSRVYIWSTETMTQVKELVVPESVSCLAFNEVKQKNGTFKSDRLAVVCKSTEGGHNKDSAGTAGTLMVYNCDNPENNVELRSQESTGPEKITAVWWSQMDPTTTFASASDKGMRFWTLEGGKLKFHKPEYAPKYTPCRVLALAASPTEILAGTISGDILRFEGRKMSGKVAGVHKGGVFSLEANDQVIISGGKDGKVKIFNLDLTPKKDHVVDLVSVCKSIVDSFGRSLGLIGTRSPVCKAIDYTNNKLIVGTKGSEILEISGSGNCNIITRGHSEDVLRALAVDPSRRFYCTAAGDQILRRWDLNKKRLDSQRLLPKPAMSLAFSPSGKTLAIGYVDGTFEIVHGDSMATVGTKGSSTDESGEIRDITKEPPPFGGGIACLAFSPCGKRLACGSEDRTIKVFDCTKSFVQYGTASFAHNGGVIKMDWDVESKVLQSNSNTYELMFWDIEHLHDDAFQPRNISPEAAKNVKWATHSCIYTYYTSGLYQNEKNKPRDIWACDLHPDGDTIAVGDSKSRITLYRFPIISSDAKTDGRSKPAHSEHVTNVKFTHDELNLISTGGDEHSVMQWRYIEGDEPETKAPIKEESDVDSDVEAEVKNVMEKPPKLVDVRAAKADDFGDIFAVKTEDVGLGEEFMAVKPYKGAIFPPSKYEERGKEAPLQKLIPEWIYGYRGHDTRQNLHYLQDKNKIVYCIAGTAVVMNIAEKKQEHFYFGHNDDIVSLAKHPTEDIIATGQLGKRPAIHLWSPGDTKPKVKPLHFHERGVTSLSFNRDGTLLASVGLDNEHSVAVWEVGTGKLLASSKCHQEKIFQVAFSDTEDTFACVGVKLVKFFKYANGKLSSSRGSLLKGNLPSKLQNIFACCFVNGCLYTGNTDGTIYKFQGNGLVKVGQNGHKGKVVCAVAPGPDGGIISGGKDGSVVHWEPDLGKIIQTHTLSDKVDDGGFVRSLAYRDGKILIGTKGSGIHELDVKKQDVTTFMRGHGPGELWGLATHPTKSEVFATVGDDATLRIWNTKTHEQTYMEKLDGIGKEARSVAYSKDDKWLAIGFKGGDVAVFDLSSGTPKRMTKDIKFTKRKEEIGDIKFSPNSNYLAVGSHDNFVDVYSVSRNFKKVGTCKGHSSYITHFDWSADSTYLQTNCGGYELLFWDAASCTQITRASALKDVEWETWTCVLGWPVQTIYPPGTDGTDINAVCRSYSGEVLATADDSRMVNLFRYPVIEEGAECNTYSGHSEHVTNVRFTNGDRHLISTGGADLAIIQWRYQDEDEADSADEDDDSDVDDLPNEANMKAKLKNKPVKPDDEPFSVGKSSVGGGEESAPPGAADDPFAVAQTTAGGGEESGAVKAWVGPQDATIPDEYKEAALDASAGAKPACDLELQWVYGYRAHDTRANLHYLKDGRIAYHAAATGVLYDYSKHTQSYFQSHNDDILCLDYVNVGGEELIATGQTSAGKNPPIFIWNPNDMKAKHELKAGKGKQGHQMGILAVAFSKDGKKLASVGIQKESAVCLWNVETGQNLNCEKDTGTIITVKYHPSEDLFVTLGVKHVKFWTVTGPRIEQKKGTWGKKGSIQTLIDGDWNELGEMVTGSKSGDIYIWKGTSVARVKQKGHGGPISAVRHCEDGMLTGGKDGMVILWDQKVEKAVQKFDLIKMSQSIMDPQGRPAGLFGNPPSVKAVDWNKKNGSLLVGTKSSEICEINVEKMEMKIHMQGHCDAPGVPKGRQLSDNEIWGLAAHPLKPEYFATCSEDTTVRIWNSKKNKIVAMRKLKSPPRCCTYSWAAKTLACGTMDGKVIILSAQSLSDITTIDLKKSDRPVADLKYSPDNEILAVATFSPSRIYLFKVSDGYKKLKSLDWGGANTIAHLDFSTDGAYLCANSNDGFLRFVDIASRDYVSRESNTKGARYKTYNVIFNWPAKGLMPLEKRYNDTSDLNSCCASVAKDGEQPTMMASGDDFGCVNLWKFPCVMPNNAKWREGHGHSAHVTNVAFVNNNEQLVSTGGGDRCVFQWKIVEPKNE